MRTLRLHGQKRFTNLILYQNEIIPYKSKNLEGFDINTKEDWILLQHFVKKDPTLLPIIEKKPYIADSN